MAGHQWTDEEFEAWANSVPVLTPEQIAEGDRQAQEWQTKRDAQAAEWRAELKRLGAYEDGDEYLDCRIQCLRADLHAYEAAKAALEGGYEDMADNPYEQGLG